MRRVPEVAQRPAPGLPADPDPVPQGSPASERSEVRAAIRAFLLTGLAVLLVTAVPATWWLRAVAEEYAAEHVLRTTQRLADHAVAPLITGDLLDGEVSAVAEVDARLRPWLEEGSIRRIKIWDREGTVVYSDEHELIGRRFTPSPGGAVLTAPGEAVVTFERQRGTENAHEEAAGPLVEVYAGFTTAAGEPMVFEVYYDDAVVRTEQRSVLLSMSPAILLTMAALQLAQLVPAVRLARRIQAHRHARARLLEHAVRAAELERARVARDLHDDVIQDLAGLSYALEAQEAGAGAGHRAALGRACTVLQGSLRSLRGITTDLYAPDVLDLGLPEAVERLADPLVRSGVEVRVRLDPDVPLSSDQQAMFLKVAREALTNIAKHARASTVDLRLARANGAAVLTVDDDGEGFDAALGPPEGHLGLRIMQDIADAAGASLAVRSRPGGGTTVVAALPLRPAAGTARP